MSDEQRHAISLERRKTLIRHAYYHTTFYRKKYDTAGMKPEDIKNDNDFEKIPPLTREEIRSFLTDMIADNIPLSRLKETSTGGSSGIPLKAYHDKAAFTDIFTWGFLNDIGINIWDNVGYLFRYAPHRTHPILNRLQWYPTKRCFLDVSFFTDENCEHFYSECCSIAPTYLCGYVGAVCQFASWMDHKGYSLPSLKAIWTTSAPISQSQRLELQRIFNCKAYTQYGCCEVLWLAAECNQQQGLHWYDTYRHLESVDERLRPVSYGHYGEALVTDLLNFAFPLIRYRNGDRICLLDRKCTCGSQWPLMAPVRGRMTDNIYFPDGACIAGDFLTTLFDGDPEAVSSFQVIQKKDFSLVINYIPTTDSSKSRVERICHNLSKNISEKVPVSCHAVDTINHDRGKFRFIIRESEQISNPDHIQ